MELGEKIATERKRKGITQQQLADMTNLTARTIQRIENGQSIPRAFTINAIAQALDTTFQSLHAQPLDTRVNKPETLEANKHFLQLLTLSCFSYLLIPIIHFLLPLYLLKKSTLTDQTTINLARATIRKQIIWTVATNGMMLVALGFNLISAIYFQKAVLISYLALFFFMYALNALLLTNTFITINRLFR